MMTESLSHVNPEDIFAKAIERVEAGETVEAVLATAPEPLRAELREVLLLINATHHLQRAPVPQPTAPRRAERKRAFLEAAAQMKAASTLSPTPVAAPAPKLPAPRSKAPWWIALENFWHDLQASFTSPNLRLAPLLALIAVVYLSAFGFVRAASASDIGEPAYAVKQWMRNQKFNLSSEAQRPYVYIENMNGLLADINATSANLQNNEQATPQIPPQTTERLVFDGTAGDYLVSGKLSILLHYQPDISTNVYTDTHIPVMPGVGQFIDVTFQVVPNKDGASVLQAIAVIVPDEQPEMGPPPTVEAAPPPAPTSTPCQPYLPDGWVPYGVRAGDTLSAIAEHTGTTVAQLQQANCLLDANVIPAGKSINAPKPPPTNTPTAGVPTLAATLTAISTTVLTPSVGITPTATLVPSVTATVAVTPVMTATVAPTVTTAITDPVNQTPTAVQTPTPAVTVTLTVTSEPTTDGTPGTPTVTPVAPTVPVTGTVAPVTATATPTAATSATTSATMPATMPTIAVTPTASVADTPTPETLPTATTPGGGQGNTPTAIPPPPTSDPNQGGAGSGGGGELAPTNTPVPQSKSPLTGG